MNPESTARAAFRWLLAALYLAAGILHIIRPSGFLAITPRWVPFPAEVVAFTGIAEILGAIGLITARYRWAAGIGLALYAVCVFPANIHHAINAIPMGGQVFSWNYHGPRLMLQPVIFWWALYAGGVTDWPFSKKHVS